MKIGLTDSQPRLDRAFLVFPILSWNLRGFWPMLYTVRSRYLLRLLHYWLPVMLGCSLALVMHRATGIAFSHAGMTLLLAGIGAAYSFDRIIDAPAQDRSPRWLHWVLWGMVGNCGGLILFLIATGRIGKNVLGVVAMLSATSLLYSRLKRLPLVKTLAVAFIWTWACAVLPLAGGDHRVWSWLSLDVTVPVILMLSAGCILCDIKDVRQDMVCQSKPASADWRAPHMRPCSRAGSYCGIYRRPAQQAGPCHGQHPACTGRSVPRNSRQGIDRPYCSRLDPTHPGRAYFDRASVRGAPVNPASGGHDLLNKMVRGRGRAYTQ